LPDFWSLHEIHGPLRRNYRTTIWYRLFRFWVQNCWPSWLYNGWWSIHRSMWTAVTINNKTECNFRALYRLQRTWLTSHGEQEAEGADTWPAEQKHVYRWLHRLIMLNNDHIGVTSVGLSMYTYIVQCSGTRPVLISNCTCYSTEDAVRIVNSFITIPITRNCNHSQLFLTLLRVYTITIPRVHN
jgi:hypothetical protein